MALDPDLAAFLELVEAGISNGAPPLHELPPAKAREQYDISTLALDSPGMEVASVKEIIIPCRDGNEITARLYAPLLDEPLNGLAAPALLYFHGGGILCRQPGFPRLAMPDTGCADPLLRAERRLPVGA
jgi:acetyl esterase